MNILLIAGIAIIFIIITIFVYNQYVKQAAYNPNNEYKKSDKTAEIMLFYTAWCPYSQTTLKQWYTYKENYKGNFKLAFVEIDCDEQKSMADKYKIENYPTIILIYNDKNYIFDAEMNESTLTQFINTIMN
jgi:thiol-disulfide isomerase/thioredoxin